MNESKRQERWNRQKSEGAKAAENTQYAEKRKPTISASGIVSTTGQPKSSKNTGIDSLTSAVGGRPEEPNFVALRDRASESDSATAAESMAGKESDRDTKRHSRQPAVDCWRCVRTSSRGKTHIHEFQIGLVRNRGKASRPESGKRRVDGLWTEHFQAEGRPTNRGETTAFLDAPNTSQVQ